MCNTAFVLRYRSQVIACIILLVKFIKRHGYLKIKQRLRFTESSKNKLSNWSNAATEIYSPNHIFYKPKSFSNPVHCIKSEKWITAILGTYSIAKWPLSIILLYHSQWGGLWISLAIIEKNSGHTEFVAFILFFNYKRHWKHRWQISVRVSRLIKLIHRELYELQKWIAHIQYFKRDKGNQEEEKIEQGLRCMCPFYLVAEVSMYLHTATSKAYCKN